jgi:hypothetical protein
MANFVLARLYEHIEPIDRGERYEDPLQAALDRTKAGQVTGGGSQLNEQGGIDYVDIEIEVEELDRALATIVESLEASGAPEGSEIVDGEDGRVLATFGTRQCLAVFLDGVSLPDEVYAALDFEGVVGEIGTAAGANSYHGFSQGAEETGLFFFGPNADEMFARVEPVLRKLPIGQNARVVIRHGKSGQNPREVRMPRR